MTIHAPSLHQQTFRDISPQGEPRSHPRANCETRFEEHDTVIPPSKAESASSDGENSHVDYYINGGRSPTNTRSLDGSLSPDPSHSSSSSRSPERGHDRDHGGRGRFRTRELDPVRTYSAKPARDHGRDHGRERTYNGFDGVHDGGYRRATYGSSSKHAHDLAHASGYGRANSGHGRGHPHHQRERASSRSRSRARSRGREYTDHDRDSEYRHVSRYEQSRSSNYDHLHGYDRSPERRGGQYSRRVRTSYHERYRSDNSKRGARGKSCSAARRSPSRSPSPRPKAPFDTEAPCDARVLMPTRAPNPPPYSRGRSRVRNESKGRCARAKSAGPRVLNFEDESAIPRALNFEDESSSKVPFVRQTSFGRARCGSPRPSEASDLSSSRVPRSKAHSPTGTRVSGTPPYARFRASRPGSPASRTSMTSSINRAAKSNRKLNAKQFAISMELLEHVSKGRLQKAEELIRKGASPDFADYNKRTPLHFAAAEGHTYIVKMLLENGANPNVVDRCGSKPVHDAMKKNFKDIAQLLRRHGGDDDDTLSKEHLDGIELLEYCASGYVSLVREKVRAGAKITFADKDRRTPLHLASCEGHAEVVQLLLQYGADATCKDVFNHSAVDDAICNGHMSVLLVMKEHNVSVPGYIFDDSCTSEFQRDMHLIELCAKGKLGKAQKCIVEGADVLFANYDSRTALHLAVAEGHLSVVKMLLAAGADPTVEDRRGCSALDEATKIDNQGVVALLDEQVAASVRRAG